LMILKCAVGEDSWESLGLQGDLSSPALSNTIHKNKLKMD